MGDDLGGRVDPSLPVYVYGQVADDIARRVDAGQLQPGARLPAERDLAEEYG
ncbi:GntR family transcriptional regulator, partial [Streptomyces sp. A73]|nr:GntR family transcriptional regulator [Streptomyces sp. A73]